MPKSKTIKSIKPNCYSKFIKPEIPYKKTNIQTYRLKDKITGQTTDVDAIKAADTIDFKCPSSREVRQELIKNGFTIISPRKPGNHIEGKDQNDINSHIPLIEFVSKIVLFISEYVDSDEYQGLFNVPGEYDPTYDCRHFTNPSKISTQNKIKLNEMWNNDTQKDGLISVMKNIGENYGQKIFDLFKGLLAKISSNNKCCVDLLEACWRKYSLKKPIFFNFLLNRWIEHNLGTERGKGFRYTDSNILLSGKNSCPQEFHSDYSYDKAQNEWKLAPFSILLSCQDKGSLDVFPKSHLLSGNMASIPKNTEYFWKRKSLNSAPSLYSDWSYINVELKKFDVLLFSGRLIHAGAAYSEKNVRFHSYLGDMAPDNNVCVVPEIFKRPKFFEYASILTGDEKTENEKKEHYYKALIRKNLGKNDISESITSLKDEFPIATKFGDGGMGLVNAIKRNMELLEGFKKFITTKRGSAIVGEINSQKSNV